MIKKYKQIIMGSGILPIAKKNGTLYFLFGLESTEKQWSDFGGKTEKDELRIDTAIREGYEELNGFLGSKRELKDIVNKNLIIKINKIDNKYSTYIFKTELDNMLPLYFNNNHKFIKKNLPNLVDKNGLFEKCEVRWFTIDDIKNNRKYFRYFYREIVDEIIFNLNTINRRIENI